MRDNANANEVMRTNFNSRFKTITMHTYNNNNHNSTDVSPPLESNRMTNLSIMDL